MAFEKNMNKNFFNVIEEWYNKKNHFSDIIYQVNVDEVNKD